MATQPVKPKRRGRPFVKGDPRIRPGPGRPPKDFIQFCKDLFQNPLAQAALAKHVFTPRRDGSWTVRRDRLGRMDPMILRLMGYGFGMPKETLEVRTPPYDLSKLTDAQLEQLRTLQAITLGEEKPAPTVPTSRGVH